MSYSLYIFLALAPSIIWLLFYLGKDQHPEPKKMVLKVFFLGILAAGLAALLEIGILKFIGLFFPNLIVKESIWFIIFKFFLVIALIEELSKYLIVRNFVLSSSELDEPLDIMLYLIISALGFAALENLLLVFATMEPFDMIQTLNFSFSRFIGATFLHTLASGTLGFFLALSFCFQKNQKKLFIFGLGIATILHGLYNFAIMKLEAPLENLIPLAILIGLALFTTWGFIKLKKIKSICKISARIS